MEYLTCNLSQVVHHRPEIFKGQLDFGTLGTEEQRSMSFTLRNDNPISVSLSISTCQWFPIIFCVFIYLFPNCIHRTDWSGGKVMDG